MSNGINNVEIDLEDLAFKVFTKLPSGPKSIYVSFDDMHLKELFESLLTFLITGLKIRYPSENEGKVDLHLLTEEDLKKINKYMNSIGFSVNIEIITIPEWIMLIEPNFKDYSKILISNKTKLNELKCKFIVFDKVYIINFDFI